MTHTTTATKEIKYNRESRDYAYYFNGEFVGFASTYHEAEVILDQLTYELLSHKDAFICESCNRTDHRCYNCEATFSQRYLPAQTAPVCSALPDCSCTTCAVYAQPMDVDWDAIEVEPEPHPDFEALSDTGPCAFTCDECGQTKHENAFNWPDDDEHDYDVVVCDACAGAERMIAVSCDLCNSLVYATYGGGLLCETHYNEALAVERGETVLTSEVGCCVCGSKPAIEYAGDELYCQEHLDSLLARDASPRKRDYRVTGTIAYSDGRVLIDQIVNAQSRLDAFDATFDVNAANRTNPSRNARWLDVYVVAIDKMQADAIHTIYEPVLTDDIIRRLRLEDLAVRGCLLAAAEIDRLGPISVTIPDDFHAAMLAEYAEDKLQGR